MPLIPDYIQTNAALDSRTDIMAAHIENAIIQANGMTSDVLALDNAALSAWLNAMGAELESYLTKHAVTGAALNTLAEQLEPELSKDANGNKRTLPRVDVSPFTDKLAAQNRMIDVANGALTVQPISAT